MKSCPGCRRHVRRSESTCPFCHAVLRDTTAPLAVTLSLASLLVGCTDGAPEETDDAGGSGVTGPADSTGTPSGSGMVQTSGGEGSSTGAFGTTAVDDDTTTNDSATGGGFIYGGAETGGMGLECDVFTQDCPPDDKCMPWANDGGDVWNATRCTPVANEPGRPGDPCTVEGGPTSGIDDCDVGVMCLEVDAKTNMGTCVELCGGSPDAPVCTEPGTMCVIDVLATCLPE